MSQELITGKLAAVTARCDLPLRPPSRTVTSSQRSRLSRYPQVFDRWALFHCPIRALALQSRHWICLLGRGNRL